MFEMFEKNSSRPASDRGRCFHLGERDRKVAREPESECRALLPCPMAHSTRHARAVSRARATAARTPKSFPALSALPCASAPPKFVGEEAAAVRQNYGCARPRGRSRTGVEVSYSPAVSDGTCEAACACRISHACATAARTAKSFRVLLPLCSARPHGHWHDAVTAIGSFAPITSMKAFSLRRSALIERWRGQLVGPARARARPPMRAVPYSDLCF